MANIKSAKKRISIISKKTARNRRVKGAYRAIIKNFYKAIEADDLGTAKEKLALAEKKLMQAAAKGVMHKKTASRKVGRMTRTYNKAKAQA
ncbi:MAG: 30S ribosomal protein S20 [Firmicutes bacterium]|jgi:small subunit ribosomal protein S20|nr:30S ribosomal protein S20 [Bacillota bacterium]MBQ4372216.1 30S ribosomal protein S20 [Bacillota bacterium]